MKKQGIGNREQGVVRTQVRCPILARVHFARGWVTKSVGPAIICFAAFIAITPDLIRGNSCGHDFDFHLASWLDAQAAWRQGLFYPRWAPSPNYGAGEPRFVFYPPLTWMLGAALGSVFPWKGFNSRFFVPSSRPPVLPHVCWRANCALQMGRRRWQDAPHSSPAIPCSRPTNDPRSASLPVVSAFPCSCFLSFAIAIRKPQPGDAPSMALPFGSRSCRCLVAVQRAPRRHGQLSSRGGCGRGGVAPPLLGTRPSGLRCRLAWSRPVCHLSRSSRG